MLPGKNALMYKALLDTNIIIDALAARQPFAIQAERMFRDAVNYRYVGYICGSSITDVYYIIRKQIGHETAQAAVAMLLKVFTIIPVGEEICSTALDLGWNDFEDAVITASAMKAGLDFVVTRDKELHLVDTKNLGFYFLPPDIFVSRL